MDFALSTYQPFDLTKALFEYQYQQWDIPSEGIFDLCKKIALIALVIIALLPIFLLDLVIWPSSRIYQLCCPPAPSPAAPPAVIGAPPMIIEASPVVVAEERDRERERMERLRDLPPFPHPLNNHQFLREALRSALALHDEHSHQAYKNLIASDGSDYEGEEPPVNIFNWCAECLLVYFLRLRPYRLFPWTCPDPQLVGNALEEWNNRQNEFRRLLNHLINDFARLNPYDEQPALLLKIIDPASEMPLSAEALDVKHQIQGLALQITQNPIYNRQIYRPVVDQAQNL